MGQWITDPKDTRQTSGGATGHGYICVACYAQNPAAKNVVTVPFYERAGHSDTVCAACAVKAGYGPAPTMYGQPGVSFSLPIPNIREMVKCPNCTVALGSYNGASSFHCGNCACTIKFHGVSTNTLPPKPARAEAPCRQCARFNDVGVSKCYWCETAQPTKGMASRPVGGAPAQPAQQAAYVTIEAGDYIFKRSDYAAVRLWDSLQVGEDEFIIIPGVNDES